MQPRVDTGEALGKAGGVSPLKPGGAWDWDLMWDGGWDLGASAPHPLSVKWSLSGNRPHLSTQKSGQLPLRREVSQDTAVCLPHSFLVWMGKLIWDVLSTFILPLFHTWKGERWQTDNNPFVHSHQTQWGDYWSSNCNANYEPHTMTNDRTGLCAACLWRKWWVLQAGRDQANTPCKPSPANVFLGRPTWINIYTSQNVHMIFNMFSVNVFTGEKKSIVMSQRSIQHF